MKDEEVGATPDETPASPDEGPRPVHHGEALVAALLQTPRSLQSQPSPVDDSSVSPPTTPLTASSLIDRRADGLGPATSAEVPGGRYAQDGAVVSQSGLGADDGNDGAAPVEDPSSDDPVDTSVDDEDDSLLRNMLEWFVVLGAAVAVAILLRTFVFQAFYIPSESMEQTLYEGDRILVNKIGYRFHDVNRGDVVVFRRPDDQPGEIRDLIKRVIGLPGESVEGRDSTIFIDGRELVEPYLDEGSFADFGPITVSEGEMFMMGDNRDQSLDSRRFGTIEEVRIVGRAFVLFWPVDRLGTL